MNIMSFDKFVYYAIPRTSHNDVCCMSDRSIKITRFTVFGFFLFLVIPQVRERETFRNIYERFNVGSKVEM